MKTKRFASLVAIAMIGFISLAAQSVRAQNSNVADALASAAAQVPACFEKTLREFVKMAAEDQDLWALLSKHQLALDYAIPALGLRCYISFADGTVTGSFGQPPRRCELAFVSDAATLDRFLRGEDCQSEMQVSVQLSLVRKIALKRDLKQYRAAFARIYAAASARILESDSLLAKSAPR